MAKQKYMSLEETLDYCRQVLEDPMAKASLKQAALTQQVRILLALHRPEAGDLASEKEVDEKNKLLQLIHTVKDTPSTG